VRVARGEEGEEIGEGRAQTQHSRREGEGRARWVLLREARREGGESLERGREIMPRLEKRKEKAKRGKKTKVIASVELRHSWETSHHGEK